MKRFAAWTAVALSTLLLAHVAVVVFGGPRLIGYWASGPVRGSSSLEIAVSRLNEVLFPGFLGAVGIIWGMRELRRPYPPGEDES